MRFELDDAPYWRSATMVALGSRSSTNPQSKENDFFGLHRVLPEIRISFFAGLVLDEALVDH